MIRIFHFLPTSLVFEIVNPFSSIFNAISSDKSCLISTWRQDTRIFPACWILIGQFEFPARQPYAMILKALWRAFVDGLSNNQDEKVALQRNIPSSRLEC